MTGGSFFARIKLSNVFVDIFHYTTVVAGGADMEVRKEGRKEGRRPGETWLVSK